MTSKKYIGCCGAYCKTCGGFLRKCCKGCKTGFENGERNINASRCKIKLCCFRDNQFDTCAECSKLQSCALMEKWYQKNKGKYKKYKALLFFIKEKGYSRFVKIAAAWKNELGTLEEK
jgi:hypothetical protein